MGQMLSIHAASPVSPSPTSVLTPPTPPSRVAPVPWQSSPLSIAREPNALIVLTAQNVEEMRRAIRVLEESGCAVTHVFPPCAVIGFVPPDVRPQLSRTREVAAIYDSWVSETALAMYGPETQQAAWIWNHNFVHPEPSPPPEPGAPPPRPLVGDVRTVTLPIEQRPGAAPGGLAPGYYQTSEFMAGKVAVGIILPESNGALDPSTENWTAARMNQVVSEIQAAMNWWAGVNPHGNLSFYYDIRYQVPTRYEPINRPSTDDDLWIAETLSVLGYSGSDWVAQTFNYLNTIRATYGTDWAVVVFVVDSLNDPDGVFTDGYFGYTYRFLVVMTYDNDDWGINNMDSVMAHEFAHDFGAEDEYCMPGYDCCRCGGQMGYLGIPNSNCEAGCDHNGNGICDGEDFNPGSSCRGCSSCVEVNCLMRQGGVARGVCEVSRQQVGMRDLDGDGILDPVDTTPALTVDSWPPELVNRNVLTYTGTVWDVPYDSPTRPDVTINFITAVEFEMDNNGIWHSASATDGVFDETTEGYTLTTPLLANGTHSIRIRATNRVGNRSWVSDTFTVDTLPPVGSVLINSGAICAASPAVTLTLTASDSGSGVDRMMVANTSNFGGATWITYSESLSWTLTAGDGLKTVYVKFRDRAGNISAVYTDTIFLDTTPPSGTVVINGGALYASQVTVTLSLTATDATSGLADQPMRFSNNGSSWTTWETYTPVKQWTLAGADGLRTVYVQYRDKAGNTATLTDTIVLDRVPPASSVLPLPAQSGTKFTVAWSGSDATSGIATYDVEVRRGLSGLWETWLSHTTSKSATFTANPGQTYYFRSRARDRAGNLEEWPVNPNGDTFTYVTWRVFLPLVIRQ